jgi:hypothetical protein
VLGAAAPADWAQTGILGGVVAIVVFTGLKGQWLFRWTHDAIVAQLQKEIAAKELECEQWKGLALSQVGVIEQTVDRTARVIYRAAEQRNDVLEERAQIQADRRRIAGEDAGAARARGEID